MVCAASALVCVITLASSAWGVYVRDFWSRYAGDYSGGFAGITIDPDGDIWASCPVKGFVTCFSALDGTVVSEVAVGRSPGQVCVDSDGRLYTVSFEAIDALGAASAGSVRVMVPPDGSSGQEIIDDGRKYDSTKVDS